MGRGGGREILRNSELDITDNTIFPRAYIRTLSKRRVYSRRKKKGKRKLGVYRISSLVSRSKIKPRYRFSKPCSRDSGKPGSVSLLFLFFPLSSSSFRSRWRALDAPVELVGKLIAPPPRFNSIIQAASCRCKFHPIPETPFT